MEIVDQLERHVWVKMEQVKLKFIHFLSNKPIGLGNRFEKVVESSSFLFSFVIVLVNLVTAPIIPSINNDEDTSNFNEVDKRDGPVEECFSTTKAFAGNHLAFIGFSYSYEYQ